MSSQDDVMQTYLHLGEMSQEQVEQLRFEFQGTVLESHLNEDGVLVIDKFDIHSVSVVPPLVSKATDLTLLPPGSTIFIDGTDPDAVPPLTLREVRLWERVRGGRGRVVGKLGHGTRVRILDRWFVRDKNRYYYRVRSWWRTGWVAETFLSREKKEPIGELV